MATSGISINQLSRDDIINAALRKLVVIGEGQTANATQITTAAQCLNNIIAEFRTLGMSIWARKTLLLTLVQDQKDYIMGIGQPVNIPYPLRIYTSYAQLGPDYPTNIQMNQLSFTDFNVLPNKSGGTPVNFNYQPQINTGIYSVWPTPDASVPALSRISIEYQTPFEYFVAGVDTPDFPEEYNNALIYHLALQLADEYAKPMSEKQWLERQAMTHLGTALAGGAEEASLYIQPSQESFYGFQ